MAIRPPSSRSPSLRRTVVFPVRALAPIRGGGPRRLAGFVLGTAALALSLPLGAQTPADTAAVPEPLDTTRWSPALSMRYLGIQDTELSPDGSLVAFVVREPLMEGEKSEYLSHIWMAPADGVGEPGEAIQFTRGPRSATSPDFSPDGRYLAFLSARGEARGGSGADDSDGPRAQVWVMSVRGGEAWAATAAEAGVSSFAWSPDGSRIAYTMRDPDTEEEKKAKREKRDVILVDQEFDFAHLYTVAFDPAADSIPEATRLTSGDFHVMAFDWSPDGRSLVFAHAPDTRIDTFGRDVDLSVVPADGGEVRALVTRTGVDGSPLWSPDGAWIAFTSHGGTVERVGLADVWVAPAAGGEARKLADTPDRSANLLAWGPDSRTVYVLESAGVDRHVVAVPLEGEARPVTSGPGVIGSPSFDRQLRRIAFTWEDPDTPEEVYVAPLGGEGRTRISAVNADAPRPAMGRTEVLTWTAPDGTPVEGLLTYPIGYREGRRYPLILNVHGGPAGVFSRTFTGSPSVYMLQYFAQNGYAILRPNPRGSSGYGRDFRYANVRDWGYGDFSDLMSGVDTVIAMGVGHPDSLAIMGWSYGGYMTSFAVTRTDRFKAASMGAGLPNLISMVTTTDIPTYLVAHLGGEFWEDFETYEKHSAIYHIENVTTPTQVIHGANDLRVPFTQGQEFYVALKRRGVPTEFIVYPRTPHGPQEPKFVADVSPRILAWFERYVRGKTDAAVEAITASP